MQEMMSDVFRVQPSKVTPTKYSSFFVRRKPGNLVFACYAKGGSIESSFDEFEKMGGVERQFLGDMHHKSSHCDEVFLRFGAYTYCSDLEASDTVKSVKNLRTFAFKAQALEPGIDVLPTPGHRPGSCCYLVTLGKKRILFAGDNIVFDGKRWIALPAKGGKSQMIESLKRMSDCDCDAVFSNSMAVEKVCSVTFSSSAERRAFFESIVDHL